MNLRTKIIALLLSIGVLLAMSYVHYWLERAALEAEHGLKEHIIQVSYLHIELAQWSLDIITELICAFGFTVYLRTLSAAKRWSITSIYLGASVLFCAKSIDYNLGKNPYTYYEKYMYWESLSYLSLSVSFLVMAFLLICAKHKLAKAIGIFLLCLSIFGWYREFCSIMYH